MARILAYAIGAFMLVACSESTTPHLRSLVGTWIATPGPDGYGSVTIGMDSAQGFLLGEILFTPPQGSGAPIIYGEIGELSDGISDFAHITLLAAGLGEFSLAKENCDGDQFIDPTQPLCAYFGKTTFVGGLQSDGTIAGSFGTTNCDGCGADFLQQFQQLNLSSAIVFRRP